MSKQNKIAIIEGIKELIRVALVAILPIIISSLEAGHIDWKVIGIVGLIAVLKAIDKAVHKSDSPATGIIPF